MGLLPLSPCGPPEPPESGCDWLGETGAELLATALSGLLPFIPDENCTNDTFDTYLSMGPPNAERYDALSIYLVRYGMSPQGATQWTRLGACSNIYPQMQAVWEVQLWVNCWPGAKREGETLIVPAPEKLDVAAQWMLTYGVAIQNALTLAMVKGTWELPQQITKVTIGDLTPLGPQGLAVGWKIPVTTVVG